MDAIERELNEPQRNSETMRAFGFRLKNKFSSNKAYRRPKELEWLESLRQIKGLYDPDVHIDVNASKVYPKITRSKINIVLSRLHEMLFPEIDKNWEITPTPEPKISRDDVKQIAISLIKPPEIDPQTNQPVIDPNTNQPAQPTLPTLDELMLAIKKFAAETCEKMSNEIDDQLTEMDYPEETKKVLRSGLSFGTGLMKGPLVGKRTKRIWVPGADGEYGEEINDEDVPDLQFVRVWDWYPDMSVTELEKISGSFERHVMRKHDLRELMDREDFYGDVIRKYMEEHSNGNYVPMQWEVDLQSIEAEAIQGGRNSSQSSETSETIFNTNDSRSASRQDSKRYEVLEYWGYVDGEDLEACGVTNPDGKPIDVKLEYAANVWLIDNYIIKVALFPGALKHYKVFYYEKDETSIFGEGLARVMRHSQIAIAAAARMVLDNGAVCSGPQVEVNWNLLTEDTDMTSFYPRKIWYRKGTGIDASYPAIRVIEVDSHIPELLSIIEAFKSFGDEETTLPTWMIGQMVNNETAQATSGRMATITISIKDVVKNFDTFTEGIIRDIYAWNMEFNPRPDIKGDFQCRARGVSSLVMKEIRGQMLTQLTATMTPEEWDYIPKRDFLQEKFKAHDIAIKLLSQEEVDKLRADRDQSAQMQLALQMQKAEIDYKRAQTTAQLTKAKKANVEAIKDAQTPPEQTEATDPRITEGEIALQQTDQAAKQSEIRRKEESHQQKLQHADMQHRTKVATDTTKTAHDIANKDKMTAHDMDMKEKLTSASAEAKKIAAKQKPAAKKPAKPAKKE